MKTFILILTIIMAVILQISVIPNFSIYNVFPNIVLIVMLGLLYVRRTNEALWWMGLGGILLDLVSPVRFGVYTLSFMIIFALNYYLIEYIFTDPSILLAGALIFISSLISNIIFLLLTHYYSQIFTEAIYTSFVGCILYWIIRYYYKPKEEVKI